MPAPRDLLCAALSAALGLFALWKTQAVTKEMFDPIVEACKSGGSPDVELVPHEPLLGGPLVCVVTQFTHRVLTSGAAGYITWGVTIDAMLPMSVMIGIEAGRSESKGIIRYPVVLGLLIVLVGVSVGFPLVWLPGFLLFGGPRTGAVLPRRAYVAVCLSLPLVILSLLVFEWDPSTYRWSVAVALLAGPILAFLPMLLWGMEPKPDAEVGPKQIAMGAAATANAFGIVGAMAVLGWAAVLTTALHEYGLKLSALWDGIWTDADPAVKFMTIDFLVLFASILVYIASVDVADAVRALAISPLVGPGAACAMILAGHEQRRGVEAKAALEKKAEKTK